METKDLILRTWQENDANALYELCQDTEMEKNGISYFDLPEECMEWVKAWAKEKGFQAIISKESNELVGFISLGDMNRYDGYFELEYGIGARYRNKGYATQAIRRMLEYGFSVLNASVVAAWVRSHNESSAHVLEKCSFTLEGRLRKHAKDKSDTLCYSILKEEWEALDETH